MNWQGVEKRYVSVVARSRALQLELTGDSMAHRGPAKIMYDDDLELSR